MLSVAAASDWRFGFSQFTAALIAASLKRFTCGLRPTCTRGGDVTTTQPQRSVLRKRASAESCLPDRSVGHPPHRCLRPIQAVAERHGVNQPPLTAHDSVRLLLPQQSTVRSSKTTKSSLSREACPAPCNPARGRPIRTLVSAGGRSRLTGLVAGRGARVEISRAKYPRFDFRMFAFGDHTSCRKISRQRAPPPSSAQGMMRRCGVRLKHHRSHCMLSVPAADNLPKEQHLRRQPVRRPVVSPSTTPPPPSQLFL